jgi:hypothetical protein
MRTQTELELTTMMTLTRALVGEFLPKVGELAEVSLAYERERRANPFFYLATLPPTSRAQATMPTLRFGRLGTSGRQNREVE